MIVTANESTLTISSKVLHLGSHSGTLSYETYIPGKEKSGCVQRKLKIIKEVIKDLGKVK